MLFVVSPINWIPNFIPVLGQLEDAAILALGLKLFFKNVPPWRLAEHEAAIGRTVDGRRLQSARQ